MSSETPPPPGPGAGPAAGAPDRIEIRLPSRADYLGAVRSVLRGFLEECLAVRFSDGDVDAIQIAFQEACINAVRHAHAKDASKPLVIGIRACDGRLEIEVEDYGPGIPPADRQPPPPDPENPREGGYGLFIMRQTMDEVRSERRGEKHVLVLVKRLPKAGPGGADR